MADSTSRWAEALREISSRLEEMPGEEGYPTYLATRLGDVLRARRPGRCPLSGEGEGAVTIVGAVSPPGGDFSEPVTQASLRVAGALWALEHGPRLPPPLPGDRLGPELHPVCRAIPRVVRARGRGGVDRRSRERRCACSRRSGSSRRSSSWSGSTPSRTGSGIVIESARLVREDFLRQSAFHEVDASCPPQEGALDAAPAARTTRSAPSQALAAAGASLQGRSWPPGSTSGCCALGEVPPRRDRGCRTAPPVGRSTQTLKRLEGA